MRRENGKIITLEDDINHIWDLHGWVVLSEVLPAHPNNPEATWIIKAKPKSEMLNQNPECPTCHRRKYPLCYKSNVGVFGKGTCDCNGERCKGCCATSLGMAEDFA